MRSITHHICSGFWVRYHDLNSSLIEFDEWRKNDLEMALFRFIESEDVVDWCNCRHYVHFYGLLVYATTHNIDFDFARLDHITRRKNVL